MTEKPKKMEIPKVELTWEQCNLIAKYYEFSATVFLLKAEDMQRKLKGTRKGSIKKKLEILRHKLEIIAEEAKEVL